MSEPRWERLEALFGEALEIPPSRREAFLERNTGGDPELRAELVALLEASDTATDYLDQLGQDLLGTSVQNVVRAFPDSPEASDPWIGRTVSHYQIVRRLGGGGMGVVYQARDLDLDRPVALKFIAPEISRDAEAKQRFLQEARTASGLDHPNICTVYEVGETEDGRMFIAMAAYEGETLQSQLKRGRLPMDQAVGFTHQIAMALGAAHARGVVHRDVKPGNVFITKDGVAKLLDFGLASTSDVTVSREGAIKGTVAYLSPEQAGGERADPRSDVWAAGVVLYEMLTGRRPFTGDTPHAAIHRILESEPDFEADLFETYPEVTRILRRTLAKDPADRFANGGALAASIGMLAAPSSDGVGRAFSGRQAPVTTTRRPRLAAVLVTSVVAIALTTWFMSESGAPPSPASGSTVSHIFWVDDNPENNAAVMLRLRELGVEVTTALSTADALARHDPDRVQLIISDMGRYEGPEEAYVARAGFHLLEELRARRDSIPIVFCTSPRGVTTHREEALAAGAADIFTECDDVLSLIGLAPDTHE